MDEIVLFDDVGFGGVHTHIHSAMAAAAGDPYGAIDLRFISVFGAATGVSAKRREDGWGGLSSSFVVVSGQWFLWDENGDPPGGANNEFGPGAYPSIVDLGFPPASVVMVQWSPAQ